MRWRFSLVNLVGGSEGGSLRGGPGLEGLENC